MNGPLYELHGVGFAYPGRAPALNAISLRIAQGEHAVLLGANGAGKSTLLMLLAGLQHPSTGRIEFEGEELSHTRLSSESDFRRSFRSRVGVLFQNSEVQLFCPTVRDEIAFGPLQVFSREEALDRTASALAAFRLEELADEAPYALSGGEKRRVALAAVLASAPEILLLDEPTANLDPRSCDELLETLEAYKSDLARTVILATHHLEIAAELAQVAIVLGDQGELVAMGPVSQVLQDEELLIRTNLIGRRRATGSRT